MSWKETLIFMVGTFLITSCILYMAKPKAGREVLKFEMQQDEPLHAPKGI